MKLVKICWNPETKMICEHLDISYEDKEPNRCKANPDLMLCDLDGNKKPARFKHGKYVDDEYWCNIVCPIGCQFQNIESVRIRNLL